MPTSFSRSFPTNIFSRAWWEDLSSNTVRLLVFGLIADADDLGRGEYTSRRIAYATGLYEWETKDSISELQEAGIVQLYSVKGKSYYQLTQWRKWQRLRNPRESEFPAPPETVIIDMPATIAREAEAEAEAKTEKEKESDLEAEAEAGNCNGETRQDVLTQIASILKMEVTSALARIVKEFAETPELDLVKEAELARDWFDSDQRKNTKLKMSATFFRSWIERSVEHQTKSSSRSKQSSDALDKALTKLEQKS